MTQSEHDVVHVEEGETLAITLFGDTSLGDRYIAAMADGEATAARLANAPFTFFEKVAPLLADSQLRIGNLETVLGPECESPFVGLKQYLGYDEPARTLGILQRLGVDAVNLANNHTVDFGPQALLSSMARLRSADIASFGAGRDAAAAAQPFSRELCIGEHRLMLHVVAGWQIVDRYQETYSYYASDDSPGVNPLAKSTVVHTVARLRELDPTALIVACPHWYANYEWAGQVERGVRNQLLDAGADLILGHGPHMLQQLEWAQRGTVAYSIGNFVFNSIGRYAKKNAPPYSLVARLELTRRSGDNAAFSAGLKLYPIMTDNLRTGFRARPVDDDELREIDGLLAVKSEAAEKFEEWFGLERDQRGAYIRLNAALSPRFVAPSLQPSRPVPRTPMAATSPQNQPP